MQGANPRELHLSPEPKGVTTSKLPAVIEDDDTSVVVDEEDCQKSTPEAELLMAHHRFQHISFSKLQEMAYQGILPQRLAQCKIPTCSACLYGKATKRAWRSKQERQRQRNQALKPGDVISVDQMVSPVSGLIAQMVAFLTKQRYKYVTVFVDQPSRMGFIYLQKTCLAEETIEAKRAFEKYAANRGVTIQAYHVDNGIFKAKKWMERMPSAKTKFDLCWRQRSPSKQHSQTKNLQAPRDDQGDAYTHIKMVAGSGNNPSLAIHHVNGKPSLQLNAALVAHRQTKSKQNL